MPSWNIHTAHAEQLLREDGAEALGVRDIDSFLLGNLMPDIYVGYMVPNVSRKIPYKDTHFADPNLVPEPRFDEFFQRYGTPGPDGCVSDLILGTWAHLVADHIYNSHANRFFDTHGITTCNEVRIKKQGDFDLFGRTLDISRAPQVTPELLRQCASYPCYELEEADLRATQDVMEHIVRDNAERHVSGEPPYQMLDSTFFTETFAEVSNRIRRGLRAYACGNASWGA